jgi:RNA polymerase-binding protein DksA
MKKADSEAYRRRLLALRARLTGELLHLSDEAFRSSESESTQPTHMAELGSDAYEQEVTLQMLQSEENLLGEINEALKRISQGVFGVCERCGKTIIKARLNVIPFTRYCVKCKQEAESRE